jgi:predicted amidohydrolase
MTANKQLKRRVRERAARTGESYTAALRQVRPGTLRIAVAQVDSPTDPRDTAAVHRAGSAVRQAMSAAKRAGARLVQFGEGTLCSPHKRLMSSDPDRLADADWSRFPWSAQRDEMEKIAAHAAGLHLWTAIGVITEGEPRPTNTLLVLDDRGRPHTRYAERMLSPTKRTYLYAPGTEPAAFTVDGLRFGCALGTESHYPELFLAYERADAHCVLLSTHGPGDVFEPQVRGHASTTNLWIAYSTCASDAVPSGVAAPDGSWAAQAGRAEHGLVVTEIDRDRESATRAWRRKLRAGTP